jgi:hypothetical protein
MPTAAPAEIRALLQIKSDKRLVFDDENVLALKH